MPKHISRLFVPPEALRKDSVVISDREQVHQIVRVLRMREGDFLVLLDGIGHEFSVKIMELSPKEVKCRLVATRVTEGEPRVRVQLFQAIPKQLAKFEEVLRHGTEVGVAEFYPLVTDYCQMRELRKRERMEHILVEAAEQSERGRVPVLGPEVDLGEVLKSGWPEGTAEAAGLGADVTLMAAEREGKTFLWDILPSLAGMKSINIVVGPEGGFTEEELSKAREAGFTLFGLGPRILRTETAGVAVASALLFGSSLGRP